MADDVKPESLKPECLRDIVQAIIDARKSEERVSPAWIATEAMTKLDANDLQQSKPLVYSRRTCSFARSPGSAVESNSTTMRTTRSTPHNKNCFPVVAAKIYGRAFRSGGAELCAA